MPNHPSVLMIDMNDNSTCSDRYPAAPWTRENEDRHRTRDRVRRLGIDVSRDRGRRPDAAAVADARNPIRARRSAALWLVRLARGCLARPARPARMDGCGD